MGMKHVILFWESRIVWDVGQQIAEEDIRTSQRWSNNWTNLNQINKHGYVSESVRDIEWDGRDT
jgi:hypothetical protein